MTLRRTRIVATLGPASRSEATIEALIQAGVNMFRMNFSHGEPSSHIETANSIRNCAKNLNTTVAIMGDLQGPKIRVSRFKEEQTLLTDGQTFVLDVAMDKNSGTAEAVGVDYPDLAKDSSVGDIYLINDGRIIVETIAVEGSKVITRVLTGGVISNNKGINRLGGGLSAPALTRKDQADIQLAAEIGVDYLAVSFPRSPEDMQLARKLALESGLQAGLISKIERAECAQDYQLLDEIIKASDGVMVARGDLGVEIGDPQLVGVQKHIIKRARKLNRVVITATQMMESMMDSPLPTRAEVFDVANAVLDGTDAVMLSGETAVGKYPVETVKRMSEVCLGAEQSAEIRRSRHRLDSTFDNIGEMTALSAMYAANHLEGAKAIVCITESGNAARVMSRISSPLPIFALSHSRETLRKCALYRGVIPVYFKAKHWDDSVHVKALEKLVEKERLLLPDDRVVITYGTVAENVGGTNTMRMTSYLQCQ